MCKSVQNRAKRVKNGILTYFDVHERVLVCTIGSISSLGWYLDFDKFLKTDKTRFWQIIPLMNGTICHSCHRFLENMKNDTF